ncbi:hypothetical protein [Alloyangia mangrovi]|uniref:hypothetical protein n=1 Tax=Alloyangia mangrovi TaxID=1779329 RepID=UPI0021A80004|nr:hypothetical protein [Alloyangia mangrovi]
MADRGAQHHPARSRPTLRAPKTRAFLAFCKSYFQPGFDFAGPRYFVEALCFPDTSKGETE